MTEKEYQRDYQHRRRLPEQLRAAEAKLEYLRRKAERYGIHLEKRA